MASTLEKNSTRIRGMRKALQAWYKANQRDLPWRQTRDPYSIWVSEIMLQQTRVAAVLEHYRKFMQLFPTPGALASAPLERVLAAWSGLGYYRRARSLHHAAQVVRDEHGGKIPQSSTELRRLPGIGRYTAAAIASIAFDEATAVVDGNVARVLSRFDGEEHEGEKLWQRAQEVLAPNHPGDWNQAMMELGAVICTPLGPRCAECPVMTFCKQRGQSVKRQKQLRHRRQEAYGFTQRGQSVWLVQRSAEASLMAGMWELPRIELDHPTERLLQLRHSITNTEYAISVHAIDATRLSKKSGKWVPQSLLHTLALTGLTRKVLRRLGWM